MPERLGILLSGGGSTYANLAEAIARGELTADIVVVVASRPEAGGCAIANALGHPLVIAADADAVTATLRAHAAAWVAMCGWLKYWDPPAPYAGRTVNIHPSLLPSYGGRGMFGDRVHAAVLAAGEVESGCTVHLVAGGYDSGPIVAQRRVPVLAGDTVATLRERVQAAERELYPRALAGLLVRGS